MTCGTMCCRTLPLCIHYDTCAPHPTWQPRFFLHTTMTVRRSYYSQMRVRFVGGTFPVAYSSLLISSYGVRCHCGVYHGARLSRPSCATPCVRLFNTAWYDNSCFLPLWRQRVSWHHSFRRRLLPHTPAVTPSDAYCGGVSAIALLYRALSRCALHRACSNAHLRHAIHAALTTLLRLRRAAAARLPLYLPFYLRL